ncbi:hypothetical protein JCM10450v2_005214 [Rhodotorula kratochvilovae]
MSDRPTLSISVSRRPSLRASLSGASSPALVSSPLSSHPPITPQNAHFWDSYFPAPAEGGVVGLQTPPMNAQASLYPTAGAFPGRKGLLRRNSSLSSVSSSVMGEDDDEEQDWTPEEEEQVRRIYDACLAKHALTEAPFPQNGPPPSNFTNMVARAVLRAAGNSGRAAARKARFTLGSSEWQESDVQAVPEAEGKKWPHSLKSTRLKILALAKERQAGARTEDTPRQADPDATPKRRQPLARQDSMDFLPDMHNMNSIARLSNMLRQPSQDGLTPPPPASAASSRFPPTAQLGALGVPLTRSASSRPSYRMQRTNSLQSIAGSPSQPAKPRRKAAAAADEVDTTLLTVPSSKPPASSHRMARTGSESSVLPARPLSRHLSFTGGSTITAHPDERAPLGSSPVKKAYAPSAGLLTPPASSKKRSQAFTFASPPASKNPLGLTLDPASTALKRDGGAAGLASAFTSPVVGAYPSPTSASPKKKKAKFVTTPVRAPSFGAMKDAAAGESAGLGLGLGIGGMSALSAEASSSMFSSGLEDNSPFLVRAPPGPADKEERMRSPSFDAPTGTFTLLDPCTSPTSLANRRSSPPKLTLTPSLSPTSSMTSMSSFPSTSSSIGSVASPLSPLFDLNELKLESLAPSPAESIAGMSDDDDSDEDFGCDGGSNAFLNPAYVRAGHEAQALRERLGAFAWSQAA